MDPYLSAQEVAILSGNSEQYIRRLAKQGQLPARLERNERNRPQYMIPLSGLEPQLQARYYKQHGITPPKGLRGGQSKPQPQPPKPLDAYTADQREEIGRWVTILQGWQSYRATRRDKDAADAGYIAQCREQYPSLAISRDILYRRWRAYKANDYDGLVDKRGSWRKGRSMFPAEIKDLFLYTYLDERALPIAKCYEATQMILRQEQSPLLAQMPSYDTVYRWANEYSAPVATLAREGEKAFNDRYGVFVDRFYDDMASNDYWIADGHTIDVISQAEDGTEHRHRMTLSAFIDARSGIYVGWVVTDNPSSDSTLCALRKAIMRYGIPKRIYVDNGREYLNHDIGGIGHRRKAKAKIDLPTPILQRLGIEMTNALPRNAQAKIIEREFRNFTFLSRLMETYCGSNVVAKPEKLKRKLRNGNIPTDGELTQVINEMIDGYFNQSVYNGKVAEDKGKIKLQVYQDRLPQAIRRAAPEDLQLLMMRSTRAQTVGKNGVYLTVSGERIYYQSDELLLHHTGQKVYLRYDPEDMRTVRVYDEAERYLLTATVPVDLMLDYGASKDELQTAMRQKRRWRNQAKDMADIQREQAIAQFGPINLLDVYMRAAHVANTGVLQTDDDSNDNNIVEMVTAPPSERQRQTATGEAPVIVDINRMIKNREKYNDGGR